MLIEQSTFFLIFMAFVLGLRHGIDLDHLATIDSIARAVKHNTRLSKCSGFLFSLGHGFVVILMSVIISAGFIHTQIPLWIESVGRWISIVFLLLFGLLTFWNIFPHHPVLPTGLRAFVFKMFRRETYNPFVIIVIGALFAISFDTFTQIALFSMSLSVEPGVFFPVILGIIFMFGMMTSDGLNGWFVSTLIQRADKRSMFISRGMGLIIAVFSLSLALIEMAK